MPRWMTGFGGVGPRITRQGTRKGDCEKCSVNLRPGYGYRIDGTLLCVHCAEKRVGKDAVRAADARTTLGIGSADDSYSTYLGYEIKTLSSYNTPYYYADGPSPLGSTNHFQTIRQLKNYMDRKVKAGKLVPRG